MTITATGDRLEVHQDAADARPQVASPAPQEVQGAGVQVHASARPTFTITDAATACSVSRKTITRKLPELAGHGAAKDDDGVWRIPVEALLAVGLHPGRSLAEGASVASRPAALSTTPPQARPTEADMVTIPRDRWDDVRIRLARAEAEAAERGMALADARLALRALTAGPAVPPRAVSAVSEVATAPPGPADSDPFAGTAGAQATSASAGVRPDQDAAMLGHDTMSGPGASVASTSTGDAATRASATPPAETLDVVPADVVAARNLAARTGGYVPAGTTPAKKRRWWQSH